ncbi:MAG: HXXEE domain-containing protein [Spirochaetae bacterium HGW-Spirochaetae-5]|nr:MAG: HXXEE domain-containing protein [Spirochaetae bacterium HGW-Spirochaetae-5]
MEFEILFLLCFSLHNLEEALWLPAWSRHAERYHKAVGENEFRKAVMAVTAAGYLITFQYFVFQPDEISKYIYSGFILMMVMNVVFPHIAATFVLKRYAPGTLTGLFLNAPVGIYLLNREINGMNDLVGVIAAGIAVSIVFLAMLKLIFARCGG